MLFTVSDKDCILRCTDKTSHLAFIFATAIFTLQQPREGRDANELIAKHAFSLLI